MRKLITGMLVVLLAGTGWGLVPTVAGAGGPTATGADTPPTPSTRIAVMPAAAPPPLGPASVRAASVAEQGQATPFPLSHMAAQWKGDLDAVVQVRWETVDGWQPWQQVEPAHDMSEGSDTVYSTLLRADGAVRVQAAAARGAVSDLQVVLINATGTAPGEGSPSDGTSGRVSAAAAGDDPGGPDAATTTTSTLYGVLATTTTTAPAPAPKVAQPPIVSRSQWGADESIRKGGPEFAPLQKLIVHHTDTPNADPDPASTVRAIYAYHTEDRGWNDIGYNFLIDEAGRIYEGRYSREYARGEAPTGEDYDGSGVIGAHALNANTGSVGVALLGTFDTQQPTAKALAALEDLLAWKADRQGIDPFGSTPYRMGDGTTKTFANISGHRDTYSTACPGDQTYAMLPAIRQAVDNRVGAAHGTTKGYWTAGRDGQVYPFGQAQSFGSMAGRGLNSPMAGIAVTPTGRGYWLLGGDGGIFSFGDATFYGSTGGMPLNKPVVALEPTRTGKGYWLVASDGGIFAYGDAVFYGSTGGMTLNKPVVGMAATPSGKGYWLVASDGGIFAYGDAVFHGSTGSMKLNSPVVGMAGGRTTGAGYWMVARDGGIFAFDVPYRGSVPALKLKSYAGSVDMAPTTDGTGYYVLGLDGGIFNFGNANFLGARSGLSGATAAAGIALMP